MEDTPPACAQAPQDPRTDTQHERRGADFGYWKASLLLAGIRLACPIHTANFPDLSTEGLRAITFVRNPRRQSHRIVPMIGIVTRQRHAASSTKRNRISVATEP
jgi:hypothetical protein